MKLILYGYLVAIIGFILYPTSGNAQTNYSWTGTTSTSWTTSTNWSPNGVPGVNDNVTVTNQTNNPIFTGTTGIKGLTISSGVLTINSGDTLKVSTTFALSASGTPLTGGGVLNIGTSTTASTSATTSMVSAKVIVDVKVNIYNNSVLVFRYLHCKRPVFISYSGSSTSSGNGGNRFDSLLIVKNSSSSGLYFSAVPDSINYDSEFYNNGTGYLHIGNNISGTTVFGGNVLFSKTSTGVMMIGYLANIKFENQKDITVTNAGASGAMTIGNNGTVACNSTLKLNSSCPTGIYVGTSVSTFTLGINGHVQVGSSGISNSVIQFNNYSQQDTTTVILNIGATGSITIAPTCDFKGKLTIDAGSSSTAATITINGGKYRKNTYLNAARVYLQNAVFYDTTYISQSTSSSTSSVGGNTFNAPLTIANKGAGVWVLANSVGDSCKADVLLNNVGIGQIRMFTNGTNYCGGNIEFRQATTGWIYIGANTGTTYFAYSKRIFCDSVLFNNHLSIYRLRQNSGTGSDNSVTHSLKNVNSLVIGACIFYHKIDFNGKGGNIYSTTFNNSHRAKIEMAVGATLGVNYSGGCIFYNDTITFIQAGAGFWTWNGPDNFYGLLFLKTKGTGRLQIGYNQTVNLLNDVYLNISGSGISTNSTIAFGSIYAATTKIILPPGKRILIDSLNGGVTNGEIVFSGFEQLGTDTVRLWIPYVTVSIRRNNIFRGVMLIACEKILVSGSVFYNDVYSLVRLTTGGYNVSNYEATVYYGDTHFYGKFYIRNISPSTHTIHWATGGSTDLYVFHEKATFVGLLGGRRIDVAYSGRCEFYKDVVYEILGTGGIINPTYGIVVLKGNTSQTMQCVNCSFRLYDFIINKSANDVIMKSNLFLDHNIDLIKGKVVFSPAGTSIVFNLNATWTNASASSYIYGSVFRNGNTNFTYPVGGITHYSPVEMYSLTGFNTSSTVRVYYKDSTTSITSVGSGSTKYTISSCEYWLISNSNGPAVSAKFRFKWPIAPCNGNNPVLMRSTSNQWNAIATTVNAPISTETTSALSLPVASTNMFTYGFADFFINTQDTYQNNYEVWQGATLLKDSLISSSVGTDQGIVRIDPVVPGSGTSTLYLKIKQDNSSDSLNVSFDINSTLALSNVKAQMDDHTYQPMGEEYYDITSSVFERGITFYKHIPTEKTEISTNIYNGILLGNTFVISGLSGLTAEVYLYAIGNDTPLITLTNTPGKSNVIQWNGVSYGQYKFIVKITDSTTPSPKVKYYEGQFVKP